MTVLNHTLGFPRIGLNRELKKALENYWIGKITQQQLITMGQKLRIRHWKQQKTIGIDLLPVGDFAWYDHILSTSLMLNNIPIRHKCDNINYIDLLFSICRGSKNKEKNIAASEMTKWFNTNYHYIVPEFYINQKFSLAYHQLFDEIDEALALGYKIKPIIIGPMSYLWLGKIKGKLFDRLSLLPELITVYQQIIQQLLYRNIEWIQIDEPILVLELSNLWKKSFIKTYFELKGTIKILLTTYFDSINHQLDLIKKLPIQGLHVDFIYGKDNLKIIHKQLPENFLLSAGIINGRNIWRSNLYYWYKQLKSLLNYRKLWIGTSCSLLHCPIDLNYEQFLDNKIKNNFVFSLQKCMELNLLSKTLNNSNDLNLLILKNYSQPIIKKFKITNTKSNNIDISMFKRKEPYSERIKKQIKRFNLPIFPITTIGSFPQITEIRNLRMNYQLGYLNEQEYFIKISNFIKQIIKEQEKLDIDVLVHGEAERNDMVEYFSQNLEGFIITKNGWVQSYGSRCVKPPIIIDDIKRNKPITVKWTCYAQSLTKKPVKGMLTGPITMYYWSFSREDISKEIIVQQISLALREEVEYLEKSGIGIIQIDEPALREGLPLKKSLWKNYLNWATQLFRLSSSVVKSNTQIHTHMCYCEFNDIIDSIILLDADILTIESSRSEMEILKIFKKYNYSHDIGPGIYDIHSPNIPNKDYFIKLLNKAKKFIFYKKIWVNPDCGLKTRKWEEIIPSLSQMVLAAKTIRKNI